MKLCNKSLNKNNIILWVPPPPRGSSADCGDICGFQDEVDSGTRGRRPAPEAPRTPHSRASSSQTIRRAARESQSPSPSLTVPSQHPRMDSPVLTVPIWSPSPSPGSPFLAIPRRSPHCPWAVPPHLPWMVHPHCPQTVPSSWSLDGPLLAIPRQSPLLSLGGPLLTILRWSPSPSLGGPPRHPQMVPLAVPGPSPSPPLGDRLNLPRWSPSPSPGGPTGDLSLLPCGFTCTRISVAPSEVQRQQGGCPRPGEPRGPDHGHTSAYHLVLQRPRGRGLPRLLRCGADVSTSPNRHRRRPQRAQTVARDHRERVRSPACATERWAGHGLFNKHHLLQQLVVLTLYGKIQMDGFLVLLF